MQKCNLFNENVLSTAKMVMVMFAMSFITIFVASCEKEQLARPASDVKDLKDSVEVLREHYAQSERTLAVTAAPKDTLAKSDAVFNHTATMVYGDEAGMKYNLTLSPTAYAYVREKLARIEVRSEAEVPAHLVKQQVISRKPYTDGAYVGEDVVEEFTYDDGQVDDLYYGYRYMGLIYGADTLATPHVEFGATRLDTMYVAKDGEQTELEKPYRVTPKYVLTFTTKGVSGRQMTSTVALQPWYKKVITDDPQVVTGEIKYEGKYVGCPITAYQLVQTVPTNKGVVVNEVSVPVAVSVTAPELREQPSLDSLFNATSTGTFKESVYAESVNEDGFTVKTMNGTYVSKNVGKESKTSIESTINFTYSFPTKFENKWGSYEIEGLKMSFEEAGFTLKSVSQDEDNHVWETINTVIPKIGTCTLDVLDELVKITVAKEKKAIPVDSTYVQGGKGDEYIITKTIIWSDGSQTTSKFQYDGRHSTTATNFGEKITSNLSWNASGLTANGTSTENEKKEFTPTTCFEVVYTTTNMKSDASNGVENGEFGFSETHPVVTFIDGDIKVAFEERKVVLSGHGAQPAANYNIVVRDGVSYKGYTYNMACGVIFDGEAESDVVSQGLLLIVADEVGAPKYEHEQTWNGNVTTVKVIKTTPHSFGDDEVETYTREFTVAMTDLSNGKVYAENTNFSAEVTNEEKSDEAKDGFWTVKSNVRNFNYVVSNGAVKREMTNVVTDGEIVFNDGTYTFTFPAKFNVTPSESFGDVRSEGDYKVTPHIETVTASIVGGPTLTTTGTTSIYVEQDKVSDTSYKTEESWNGNVFTAKVTKTIKHTKVPDEVDTFTKSFTVSMTNLSDGRVDAENTNFSAQVTNTEKNDETKDGQWTVKSTVRNFTYTVANDAVKREMSNVVTDGELVFTDGSYTHTFKARLSVSNTESLGNTTTDGDYQVTPHTTTVKAVGSGNGAPTLTAKGVTSIYVYVKKEITYQVEAPLDEVADGEAYYNIKVSRLLNGQVEKSWTAYISGVAFGMYRPSVASQLVSELAIARHDDSINDLPEQGRTYTAGKSKNFNVVVTAKEYHFRTFFNAPKDAEGKTEREVASHLNVWSSDVTFTDPDNGHVEKISFSGKAESIKSAVENSKYIRIIRITCNGDKLVDQTGTVELHLAQ